MSAHHLRRPARGARGFTLVELLVAMVAGLMVALAVVTLSKEANTTFHEETRIASAQMQLRTAVDRLRADLQRAAYMSTGNIWIDPGIATTPGAGPPVSPIDLSAYINASHMSLYSLAGLEILATDTTNMPLENGAGGNGLTPDAIELGGNFTSVEEFPIGGAAGTVAIQDAPAGGCQGQRVSLNVGSSAAIWRSMGTAAGAAADAAMWNAFQPVNASWSPTVPANPSFIVRVVDQTGKSQFVATCGGMQAAGWSTAVNNGVPYVDINPNTPIKTASQLGGGGGFAGIGGGGGSINPVQIVPVGIQPIKMQDPNGADGSKYDLTRTYLDAFGKVAGPAEPIAEYAIDLKFGLTTDSSSNALGNSSTQTECVFGLGAAPNAKVAGVVTSSAAAGAINCAPAAAMPQRVQSIRYRVVTRAPQPDRQEPLSVPDPTDGGSGYVYRYCAVPGDGGCVAGTTSWARTRTVTSEIALPNQAQMWFP